MSLCSVNYKDPFFKGFWKCFILLPNEPRSAFYAKKTKQKYKTYSNENKICIHQLHSDSVRLRTDLDYFRDEKDTNCVGQLEQRLWAEVGLMSKQQSGKLTMHSLARGPEAHFL